MQYLRYQSFCNDPYIHIYTHAFHRCTKLINIVSQFRNFENFFTTLYCILTFRFSNHAHKWAERSITSGTPNLKIASPSAVSFFYFSTFQYVEISFIKNVFNKLPRGILCISLQGRTRLLSKVGISSPSLSTINEPRRNASSILDHDILMMMVKDFLGKDQNAGNITRKAIFPFRFIWSIYRGGKIGSRS